MPSTNTTSNENQNRKCARQKWGSMLDATTLSNTEASFLGEQFRTEPNVLAIGTASRMTHSAPSNFTRYASVTQASTSQIEWSVHLRVTSYIKLCAHPQRIKETTDVPEGSQSPWSVATECRYAQQTFSSMYWSKTRSPRLEYKYTSSKTTKLPGAGKQRNPCSLRK